MSARRYGGLPAILAVLVSITALALPPAAGAATSLRTTLNEIEQEVMCPVCGTLLGLAESPQATREKAFVEKLIKEGKSKNEIKDALVAQYGDAVLAEPNGSGFSISAYVVPIVAFVLAALLLAIAVWKWRRSSDGGDNHLPAVDGPSAEDRRRLDEDLGRYDL
ncbi:MAG: cytochrome c-type biogenesis protein CcmH [Actinobacteria bacterium]|nr:cytochrome c-type biogenesis protein CcmH [Actinomycetota bacterium]